jgi:hypothetical protein
MGAPVPRPRPPPAAPTSRVSERESELDVCWSVRWCPAAVSRGWRRARSSMCCRTRCSRTTRTPTQRWRPPKRIPSRAGGLSTRAPRNWPTSTPPVSYLGRLRQPLYLVPHSRFTPAVDRYRLWCELSAFCFDFEVFSLAQKLGVEIRAKVVIFGMRRGIAASKY